MIAYPDTSFLCALYRRQDNSERALAFRQTMPEPLCINPFSPAPRTALQPLMRANRENQFPSNSNNAVTNAEIIAKTHAYMQKFPGYTNARWYVGIAADSETESSPARSLSLPPAIQSRPARKGNSFQLIPRFLLAALTGGTITSSAFAVESLPAGAWSTQGLQMAPAPPEISTPLHRDVIAISGGETHSMALTRMGRVVVWGSDIDGQLNLPATVNSGVSAIAAGGRFCAALKDGRAITWGATNSNSQLSVPGAATSGVIRIAAGWNHMLALKSNGAVVAWGANDSGQRNVPPEASSAIIGIAAGYSHSLALSVDGEVIAWGTDRPGAAVGEEAVVPEEARSGVIAIAAGFRYSLALKSDGSVIGWGNGTPPGVAVLVVAPGSGVTALGPGTNHMAFLFEDGSVAVNANGGWFDYGQADIPAAALSEVKAIAAGHNHTLALRGDGTVVAWGAGSKETPGENVSAYLHRGQCAVPSVLGNEVVAIAGDFNHTLALTEDGNLYAWGFNHYGQTAIPPDARTQMKAVAAGNFHSLALRIDGGVVAWGGNAEGQCEVPEDALTGVKAIAASGVQSVALKEDGRVISWGNQYMGGLATPLEAQRGVSAVVAGYEFILALKDDGTTVAWGTNISDQITVPVEAQSGVVAIAAGEAHSVALKADGTVLAWGSNHANQTLPGIVSGKASAIAAGGAATFRKLAQPWPSFAEAAALAGLGGADAEPGAIPFGDGVSNLLKHAFNLDLALPFTGAIPAGSPAGLPESGLIQDEMGSRWRVEFIRRKDPRLTYTPKKSTSLAEGSFVPMTATPLVEDIPGFPAWERVTLKEPVDLSITPRFFSRMEVE